MPAFEVLRIDVADLIYGEVFALVCEVIGGAVKKRGDEVLPEIFLLIGERVDELVVLGFAEIGKGVFLLLIDKRIGQNLGEAFVSKETSDGVLALLGFGITALESA